MTFLFNNMNMFGMDGLFSGLGGSFGGCYTPSVTGRGYDNWGSIYNIRGNCGMPSGGTIIGYAMGTSIFGALSMFAQSAISEKQARKAEEAAEDTIQEQIDAIKKENTDLLDNPVLKDNGVTKDNIATFDIEQSQVAKTLNSAKEDVTKNEKIIEAYTPAMEALLNKYPTINDVPENEKADWNAANEAKVAAERAEKAKPELVKAQEKAQGWYDDLRAALDKAKETIDKNDKEIESLEKQKEAQVMASVAGKKNGLFNAGQTKADKLDKKFSADGKLKDGADVHIRNIRGAMAQYIKAKNSGQNVEQWRDRFIQLCSRYGTSGLPSEFREAYNTLCAEADAEAKKKK